jgi:hypothetical protein
MRIITTRSGWCKGCDDSLPSAPNLSPAEAYVIRALTRMARISPSHATLVLELNGIVLESTHE